MSFFKGICYQPFPAPYNPSMANTTCIFFGSDVAYNPMTPIWGNSYTSEGGSTCGSSPACRDDVNTLQNDMGVTLIRLYDWEPRNLHLNFLDYCHSHGISVLVPVSNYFLLGGFDDRSTLIPKLIDSFKNADGTDYHPAIAGIIIANEPRLNNISTSNLITFTKDWVNVEKSSYSGFREVKIGHPVSFMKQAAYPAWGFWEDLLPDLQSVTTRNLKDRLILCPQTYNSGDYLTKNAESSGKGYYDVTWEKFSIPMLVTEIGYSRINSDADKFVNGQLSASITYGTANPDKLLGVCFFQFADKVWLHGSSEGMFGAFEHSTDILCTITYTNADFTHWDNGSCDGQQLKVDVLTKSSLYDTVTQNYKG